MTEQLTNDDLATMTPEMISTARKVGKLDNILGITASPLTPRHRYRRCRLPRSRTRTQQPRCTHHRAKHAHHEPRSITMNAHDYAIQSAILDAPSPEDVDPQIREQVTAYEKLLEDWHEARSALSAAEHDIIRATNDDANAFADAIKAGKPDPGEKHREAAQEAHRQAERRMSALHLVWFDADRALEALLRRHAAYTQELADRTETTALDAYESAIDQAEAIMDQAATQLEQAAALTGLARRIADPHELIGYDTTEYVQRTNLVEARGHALRLKRGR